MVVLGIVTVLTLYAHFFFALFCSFLLPQLLSSTPLHLHLDVFAPHFPPFRLSRLMSWVSCVLLSLSLSAYVPVINVCPFFFFSMEKVQGHAKVHFIKFGASSTFPIRCLFFFVLFTSTLRSHVSPPPPPLILSFTRTECFASL